MKSISNLTFLSLIAAFILSSCGGSGSNSGNERTAQELAEEKTIHDIDQLLEDMPPPSLVPFTLKSIGADFSEELINSLDNVEKYKGNKDKMSLNMGTFASDISYLAAYGEEEKCIEYFKASHQLAEALGDSAIYDEEQLQKFQGHIKDQNEEEISRLLSELFMKTSIQMEEDHHLSMAGLALTGSFVEGLYQAVVTIEEFPETKANQKLLEPLVKIVLGEEKALRDILEVLNDLPFDDTIADILTELAILERLYQGDLKEIDEKMESDPNFIVSKSDMRDITLEVKRIRKAIIE